MKQARKTNNRRQFMKDGLRAVLLSGLVFTGLSLGRRGGYRSGAASSCSVDLPCGICSRLPGCGKPEAVDTKRRAEQSRYPRTAQEEPSERSSIRQD